MLNVVYTQVLYIFLKLKTCAVKKKSQNQKTNFLDQTKTHPDLRVRKQILMPMFAGLNSTQLLGSCIARMHPFYGNSHQIQVFKATSLVIASLISKFTGYR